MIKELFTEVWTRLKELRKAGEAQGNKFSGFCGVLSSLTIYTFYYYLWQVLGWGFTKIVPDQRGLPLPRLCLSPGKPTPIDKSPGMPRISLLIMTIKLLLKAIPALELMPLLPLQQKTTFLSVPSRFCPLSVEYSVRANLCLRVTMRACVFLSGPFLGLYIPVVCTWLSFISCLHLLCFPQDFLPPGFTFMCLSLFFFSFGSCYVHLFIFLWISLQF